MYFFPYKNNVIASLCDEFARALYPNNFTYVKYDGRYGSEVIDFAGPLIYAIDDVGTSDLKELNIFDRDIVLNFIKQKTLQSNVLIPFFENPELFD